MPAGEIRPPDYRVLGDELLIELLKERTPVRRSAWVGETSERPSFSISLQRKLAANPSGLHPTHLRQRLNRTVDWLSEQGLVHAESRGLYVLTPTGRSRALRSRREARARIDRLKENSRRTTAPAAEAARSTSGRPNESALPAFVRQAMPDELGEPYRGRRKIRTTSPEPFSWDADDKDRNTQAHEDVLWQLSVILADYNVVPRVRNRARPRVDLTFRHNGAVTIVEIKSLPDGGHEHQVRVGLGQVLQYRRELQDQHDDPVRAVLCVPSQPQRHDLWLRACADVGVALLIADAGPEAVVRCLLNVATGEARRSRASTLSRSIGQTRRSPTKR